MKYYLFPFIALLLLKPACAAAQDSSGKMAPKEIKLLIDSLDNALNRWYIYPDKAALMIQAVRKKYKSGAYNTAKDRSELSFQLLNDLRQAHKDGHLDLRYNPQFATYLQTTVSEEEMQRDRQNGLNAERENNFWVVKAEVLPGNIGYVRWDGFSGFVKEAKPTFDAAFQFVSNSKALIIDMRYNGGGSPEMVLQTQSYFFEQKTRMNDIVDRNNDTVKGWADPAATDIKLTMPVYILTSHYTFSGAEDFTYGMQQVKRAVIVGDTTGGGAHPTRSFTVGQGFVMDIPTHRSPNSVSKTDWEGTGITPDVAVPSADALTKAQLLIFAELLTKTTDERDRQKLQWNAASFENRSLLAKQVQEGTIKIANETMAGYCGEYHPSGPDTGLPVMTIVFDGNYLYRRYEGAQDLRLVPVSATKFVYNDDSGRTMEFVMDKDQKVTDLILSNQNGAFTLNRKQ